MGWRILCIADQAVKNYAIAVVTIAVAVLLRWLLMPWLGNAFPLATMFSAVAFMSWFGGWGPALFVAALGYVVCDILFIPGVGLLGNGQTLSEAIGLLVYFASCGSVIVLGESTRNVQHKLASSNTQLTSKIADQSLIAAIVESSDDAIISKTLDGIITSWNAGATRLFGYEAREAIGQSIAIIIPPDRMVEEAGIIASIRRGERVDHLETVRHTKDGRRVEISVTISPIRDGNGAIIGASKIARDIGERRRVLEALKDADRHKDEFIATLAHELRNPLAPITTGLHVLRTAGPGTAAAEKALEIMERQIHQMVRLVDDLLDVARISTGKVEIRKRRIALADVVRSAAETSLPLIDRAGQTLAVIAPDQPAYVEGDATRLAQVFANLLNNSSKYSDRGQKIELRVTHADGFVVVSVRDEGIGIPAELLPRVFEMFRQVDRSAARAQGGLGIGLYLVKRIVEMHGGIVEARSGGAGLGSEFIVRLPVVDAEDAETLSAEPVSAPIPQRRVLIVDDNEDAAESLATHLRIKGHDTRLAFDGVSAINIAEQFQPDVMFVDIGMPRLDGHETARRIRSFPWGKKVLLVALTGWGHTDDRRRSHLAGFDHHLVKPADHAAIDRLVAAPPVP